MAVNDTTLPRRMVQEWHRVASATSSALTLSPSSRVPLPSVVEEPSPAREPPAGGARESPRGGGVGGGEGGAGGYVPWVRGEDGDEERLTVERVRVSPRPGSQLCSVSGMDFLSTDIEQDRRIGINALRSSFGTFATKSDKKVLADRRVLQNVRPRGVQLPGAGWC